MSAVQHVVWDWNGTLFDDLDARVQGMNAVCNAFSVPHIDAELFRQHHTRPARLFYENVIGRPLDDNEFTHCEMIFLDSYAIASNFAQLAPDAYELMTFIHARGATQSILSMWQHSQLIPLAERLGINKFCLRVDGVEDLLGLQKADYLARHLKELEEETHRNLANESTLMIGDIVDDAEAAQHTGIRIALVAVGAESPETLRATGFPTFDSLEDAVHHAFI